MLHQIRSLHVLYKSVGVENRSNGQLPAECRLHEASLVECYSRFEIDNIITHLMCSKLFANAAYSIAGILSYYKI